MADQQHNFSIKALGLSIVPNRCVLDDFEILSFESELEQQLFSFWDEARRLAPLRANQKSSSSKTKQVTINTANLSSSNRQSSSSKGELLTINTAADESISKKQLPSRAELLAINNANTSGSEGQSSSAGTLSAAPTKTGIAPGMTLFINNIPVKKHKFNKAYSRFRQRSEKVRNILRKQNNYKLNNALANTLLNPWTAYNAIQALAEPTKLSTQPAKIDCGSSGVITYSDRINPRQVAEYRKKARLPTSLSFSKKSSSASYDAYEIMQVLANSTKNNITIARTTRPMQQNTTTPQQFNYTYVANPNKEMGIVSTQLHLQARAYRLAIAKCYSEERKSIDEFC